MIPTTGQRTLNWYFENYWLPSQRPAMHGSMVGSIKRTVADFIRYAERDPAIDELTDVALDEFERFSLQQGFSTTVAANRRERIATIRRHALPSPAPVTAVVPAPLSEGAIRHYVKVEFPKVCPDLKPASLKDCVRVVNRFCDWYGSDIDMATITPAIVAQFEEAKPSNKVLAIRLRSLLRTFDPVKFKIRNQHSNPKATPLSGGIESAFLLANVYEKRYEPTALRSRAVNTKRLYRTTLKVFSKFLRRSATLDDLNDDTVARFASWRLGKGLSKHSVNKDLFNLLALWRWCHRKGLVETWPDVEMENAPRRAPVAWTEVEIKKLYKFMAETKGKIGKLPAAEFWCALLLTAWCTGERINAIFSLEWSNVDLRRAWVRFPAEDRKGGRDDSSARLSNEAVSALRKIRAKDGPVFPWPYSFTYLWHKYGELLKQAGLPNDRKSKFHRIRKTVASYAEAAGGNATAMLRHSKREVTESYLDPRIVHQQQPADVLFNLEGGAV